MSQENESQWHMNKSVPLALIATIFLQTAGAIWWASAINQKVEQVITEVTKDAKEGADENLRQWARIGQLENSVRESTTSSEVTSAILGRVEKDIDTLYDAIQENNKLLREVLK